jgi:hypothetical protein
MELFPEDGPSIRADMMRTFFKCLRPHAEVSHLFFKSTSNLSLHDEIARCNKKLLERLDNLEDSPPVIESGAGAGAGAGAEQTAQSRCRTNTISILLKEPKFHNSGQPR